jgi:hypothetical protein
LFDDDDDDDDWIDSFWDRYFHWMMIKLVFFCHHKKEKILLIDVVPSLGMCRLILSLYSDGNKMKWMVAKMNICFLVYAQTTLKGAWKTTIFMFFIVVGFFGLFIMMLHVVETTCWNIGLRFAGGRPDDDDDASTAVSQPVVSGLL